MEDLATPDLKAAEEVVERRPPMYHVILFNDDYTPAEFVVEVLQRFFGMGEHLAMNVMLEVHQKGKGVLGTFSKDVAETKSDMANEFAQANEHPLRTGVEQTDS